MMPETLTFHSVDVRAVVLKLRRPVVARIATIGEWPLILIDLKTEEGIVGRSYLEPYIVRSMNYLVPALRDMGAMLKGRKLAPAEIHESARKSLHFVGYEGMAMIAVSGIDMAAWDTLAKAAGMPLCTLLGASPGPVRAYNSNGLWLKSPSEVAAEAVEIRDEGQFEGVKLRLGGKTPGTTRHDRCASPDGWRRHAPDDRFQPGSGHGGGVAPCHMLDDLGLTWLEEPVVYDNFDGYAQLARDLKTPLQIGENFYGPRDLHKALHARACDYVMPDFMRIGGVTGWMRAAGHCRRGRYPDVDAPLSRGRRPCNAGDRDRALAGVAGLGRSDPARALRDQGQPPAHPGRAWGRPDWNEDVVARNLYEA